MFKKTRKILVTTLALVIILSSSPMVEAAGYGNPARSYNRSYSIQSVLNRCFNYDTIQFKNWEIFKLPLSLRIYEDLFKNIINIPNKPETPGEIEEPEVSELPEENETPEVPETPETPGNQETPEVPETPKAPEKPKTQEPIERPETPGNEEEPKTPETEEETETPEAPETEEKPEAPETTEPPKKPEESKPEKPQTPSKPETPGQSSNLSQQEQEVVRLVNIERTKAGLNPLVASDKLSNVAREKSKDMAINNYFSHTSPTYGSPFEMMREFGISYRTAGENIAMGYQSAQSVVNGWMNSPGHRANILNPSFGTIGVGAYKASGGSIYWTQMFTD